MKRIIELKERNFADANVYDYAPQNVEDALDSYQRVHKAKPPVCQGVAVRKWEIPLIANRGILGEFYLIILRRYYCIPYIEVLIIRI